MLPLSPPTRILSEPPCSQTGRAHLLLISRTPGFAGGAIGVISLEGKHTRQLVVCSDEADIALPDIIEVCMSFFVNLGIHVR